MTATPQTEIRKLQAVELYTLARILDISDSWKKLMAIIPSENDENIPMFTSDHVKMIEQGMRVVHQSGGEVFLSEWSTMGRKPPTCQSMLDLLIKAKLFRAADYVAVDILKGEPAERPKFGPAARVDTSDEALKELLRRQVLNAMIQHQPLNLEATCTLNFREQSSNLKVGSAAPDEPRSDLMKFSVDQQPQSDLMKFSADQQPQSDLMKFSEEISHEHKSDEYVPQEVRSANIPVFLRNNEFKLENSSNHTLPDSTKSDATTFASSDCESTSKQEDVSRNIPFAVLQMAELQLQQDKVEPEKSSTDAGASSGLTSTEDESLNGESTTTLENVPTEETRNYNIPLVVLEYNRKLRDQNEDKSPE